LVARAFKSAEAEDRGKGAVPGPKIPAGYYYMLGHTWLKIEEADRATVGVVPNFLQTVGIITQLELPKVNDVVTQGNVCGKISDADRFVHRIWSPASGRVIEVNARLAADSSLLRRDPFYTGFLFRIETSNLEEDLKGLLLAK
jgi:glycine cleavage system H protein